VTRRPVGEFGHVERADVGGTGGIQALERRRGLRRNPALADLRAAVRHASGAIKHVLMRERDAGERTAGAGRMAQLGFDEGVDAWLPARDARAARLEELLRRNVALRQPCARLRER